MLTYSIKLDDRSIHRDELVWGEKYLAPDLSFVSGVTSQDYHLERKNQIAFSIGNDTNADALNISCNNVTRNGYIVIKDKTYDIQSGETINYTVDDLQSATKKYRYVDIGGVVYYISANTTSITVKNWLKESWSIDGDDYAVSIVESDVEAKVDGNFVYLDTVVWIEDETVEIDGYKYFFDRYDISSVSSSPGGIKYYEDGECLAASAITRSKENKIYYNHFDDISDYIYVTKFVLTKKELKNIQFDKISFCTYFYYVLYKNNYCPVRLSGNNESEIEDYVCDVPKRLYIENIESNEYYETAEFNVYFTDIEGNEKKLTTKDVSRISLLKDIESYIKIEGITLPVSNLLQNSNHGDEIGIYLTYDATNISIGDIITLEDEQSIEYVSGLYSMSGETFVLYDNKKYKVIDRLCDKVLINKHEYPIDYINGIKKDVDALVDIMGEKVPMKIVDDAGTKLERYGEIVSGTSNPDIQDSAVTVTYDIVQHNGIKIKDNVYQVYSAVSYSTEEEDTYNFFIQIEEKIPFQFVVKYIEGSSLLVCTPNFNIYEFDDEFRDRVNASICDYFVTNQSTTLLYVKNKSFGVRDITSEIGYSSGEDNPVTSNDYYNLFNNLVLYVDTGHIHIPLKLDINVANNMMQEDLVNRDFYETEKERAINGIVDMEKDVYIPKYIFNSDATIMSFLEKTAITPEDRDTYRGAYIGSYTEFHPISEIEVNPHFRTRNLDNWKVNDGYNDISTYEILDNWFVTDLFPYNEMPPSESGEVLQNTADLIGLLFFTNDDIYYQRNKVGKSFLRFSYYDSPDPNTQSLMATSTVFVDEHKLFKKYIDNSRKNVYDYGLFENHPVETEAYEGKISNKISVMTEYIGAHDDKRKYYKSNELSGETLSGDTRRLSSKFIINNKYETDTSSEGFYLYMFKEYSEKLHPKPIYMKVEFNHAGIGRTIPFIVPMHWVSGTTATYNNAGVNIFNPERRLRLSAATDVDEMKSGYTLSQVYAQTYIPLYAVYDFKEKEYAYVFDERYINPPVDSDGRVVLNLFELKIAYETEDADTTKANAERNNVTMGRGTKSLININNEQFDRQYFNKDYR